VSDERFQQAQPGVWIGIAGNIALAFMKAAISYLSGSKALLADALRSFSDCIGTLAVLLGLRATKLAPDKDPSCGRGNSEPISVIIALALLLAVGFEIAISSAKAIYYGVDSPPKPIAFIAIAISIIVKEAMFQYKIRSGTRLRSQPFIADAWSRRSDIYSSLAVFVGVGGALLGDYTANAYLYYLDPIAGLFVAALVLKTGYRAAKESIHNMLDRALHEEDAAELIEAVQEIKGIVAVDEFRAREHGHYVIVDMKISVNPQITVQEGQDIAQKAKRELMKRFTHVADVTIHVNPYDPGYPYKNNADSDREDFSSLLH